MTAEQNARLQMMDAVIATCNAHPTATAFATLGSGHANLILKRNMITEKVAQQQSLPIGDTQAKAAQRKTLEGMVLRIADTLVLRSHMAGDSSLSADVRSTRHMLAKMNENKLLGHALKVINKAKATTPADLTALGLTAADITLAEANLTTYTEMLGERRHKLAESRVATALVEDVLDEMDEILEQHMDPAAKVLSYTDPEFYMEYAAAREIVDPGYGVRELTVKVRGEGEGLAGVIATINPGNITKMTSPNGVFYINNMNAGTYTMVLSSESYQSKTQDFIIVDNQATVVSVDLVPNP